MAVGLDAVLYLRYSDKNQKELSIEGQMRICTEYCEKNNYNIVGSYIDRAKSGKSETREEFQQMMRDAPQGRFRVVVVYKLNRFFRDRLEAALYRKELRKSNVVLLSATEDIPEGRGGIYYEAILEADAEVRSMEISEDTMRGMQDAAGKCQVTGPLPLGYKSVPINPKKPEDGKRIEIEPAEAAIVRRAFVMYADGRSMADICAAFNNEGLRTKVGRAFRISGLAAIFKNVKYMGIYKYKDVFTVENGCPAIVDAELFAEVGRRLNTSAQAPARGKATEEFFLSTKLFCGKCDKPMFGDSANRKGERYYYYSCSNRRKTKACDKKNIPKEVIEKAVFKGVLDALTDENIAIIATETQRVAIAESENARIVHALQNELAGVNEEIENISKAIAMGIITETTKDLLMDAEKRRADLKQRIVREQIIADRVVTAESVATFLKKFRRKDPNNLDFKRTVFDLLVHKVYAYDGSDDDGYAIIWCNIGKGIEIKVDLFGYGTKRGAKRKNPNHFTFIGDGFGFLLFIA